MMHKNQGDSDESEMTSEKRKVEDERDRWRKTEEWDKDKEREWWIDDGCRERERWAKEKQRAGRSFCVPLRTGLRPWCSSDIQFLRGILIPRENKPCNIFLSLSVCVLCLFLCVSVFSWNEEQTLNTSSSTEHHTIAKTIPSRNPHFH